MAASNGIHDYVPVVTPLESAPVAVPPRVTIPQVSAPVAVTPSVEDMDPVEPTQAELDATAAAVLAEYHARVLLMNARECPSVIECPLED